jgi:drug/metabolite transporter (DMT)-like permease
MAVRSDESVQAGLDAQIPPGEAAKHVALIALELQLALVIAMTYHCGPFQGMFILLMATIVMPFVMVPVEMFLLGIPALVALRVLRKRERTGRRRIWWRVQIAGLTVLLTAFVFAVAMMLAGHATDYCELF